MYSTYGTNRHLMLWLQALRIGQFCLSCVFCEARSFEIFDPLVELFPAKQVLVLYVVCS